MRPVVNHFVADQRDVFQTMEELLSEKPWFAGRKRGWRISIWDLRWRWRDRGAFCGRGVPEGKGVVGEVAWEGGVYEGVGEGGGYDLVNFA